MLWWAFLKVCVLGQQKHCFCVNKGQKCSHTFAFHSKTVVMQTAPKIKQSCLEVDCHIHRVLCCCRNSLMC